MDITPAEALRTLRRIIDTPLRQLVPQMFQNLNWTNTKKFAIVLREAYYAKFIQTGSLMPLLHFTLLYSGVMFLGTRKKIKASSGPLYSVHI
jgi:hypothetical protein